MLARARPLFAYTIRAGQTCRLHQSTLAKSCPAMASASGKTVAPYGAWKSPITADLLTQKNVSFGEIAVTSCSASSADVVFVEKRPQEKGRAALVKNTINLATLQVEKPVERDLIGEALNVRSGVHEYGGGALATSGKDKVLLTDFVTFGVFEVDGESEPRKLTPDNKAHRFADFDAHPVQPFFVCILEDHTHDRPAEVVNTLVAVNKADSTMHTLVSGADFYSSPRISPDGRFLAWVSWNHPSMPFFATQLWVAQLLVGAEGKTIALGAATLVGEKEADEVSHHPVWSDAATLIYSNDGSGFANLYKVSVQSSGDRAELGAPQPLCPEPLQSEFIEPAWSLNNSSFALLANGWIACTLITKAITSLALLHLSTGELRRLNTPFVVIEQVRAIGPSGIVFAGIQYNEPSAIVAMDLSDAMQGSTRSPRWKIIKRSSNVVEQDIVPRDYLSQADVIEFPTELPNGKHTSAHAVIFPPCNPAYVAPAGTSPPCIVKIHGGPTASATAGLNLQLNYWTSRGYMICLVNYGGSTGYGREYMLRLEGQWGVVDVRDAVAAATYLSSSDHGSRNRKDKATRRITQQGQLELSRLHEKRLPSGAVEFSLSKPDSSPFNIGLAAVSGALISAGTVIPGLQAHHGLVAAGLAWIFSKLTHVERESVLVIPTVGLQLTTTRGFTLPKWAARKAGNDKEHRFITTSKQTKLIPRDCILDVFTNEAIRRWGVLDYIAVATRSPRASKTASRGDKLDVLFPNMLPRLPVVEHVYRTIYPAIFGHDAPRGLSSSEQTEARDAEKAVVHPLPLADPSKMAISGGSAGGFTVLASLCLYPRAFSAGCSSYGVSDIAALDAESHKFESRYTDRLMGGSPAQIPNVYRERSPINMADRIRSPVLLLQGDQDKIVPPEQSESVYKAIQKDGGGKAKYILFEGEGHGFRMAANIKRALEEEEAWYRECFGIEA